MKKIITILIIGFSLPLALQAGDKDPKTLWTVKDPFEQKVFIENMGQYELRKKASASDILFGARQGAMHYYFTRDGIWIKRFEKVERTRREIERFKKQIGEEEKDGESEEKVDNLAKYKWVEYFHRMKFVGGGGLTTIISEDAVSTAYNFHNGIGKDYSARGFKKITYKNLYPGIDMEFVFPEDKTGFKYNFIVHPGADPNQIRISYPENDGLSLSAGNIIIKTPFGDFTDHAPVAEELKSKKPVTCSFALKNGTVRFSMGDYDKTKDLYIDPWTSVPVFAGGNTAYDVDWDQYGNCYAYGGTSPFQLVKFSPAGTQLWTYTNGFASGGGGWYYGDFAVNRATGSAFLIDGFNGGGAAAEKVNLAGGFATGSATNANFQEMWRIVYSRCTNQVVVAGGGTTSPSFTGATFDTSLTGINIANVINSPTGLHDMWGVAIDALGMAYFVTAKTQVGSAGYDNMIFKVPTPALSPITYSVATTYSFVEVASSPSPGPGNGFNGIAMSNSLQHLYTYDSYNMHKWNTNTGAVLGNVSIAGASQTTMTYGGLTVDECDHVFLGLNNTIRQYDGITMTQVANMPAAGTVYDCFLGMNNILYSCGINFVTATQVNLPPCTVLNPTDSVTNGTCQNPTGSATVTVNGGTPPFNINWNSNPPQSGAVLSGVTTGTYVATITDASCPPLTATDTVVITTSSGVTVNAQVTHVSCTGGSNGALTLTVTPTGTVVPTYTWSTGANTPSISGLPAGNYTLNIGTGGPCNLTLTYVINEPPPITYTLTPGTINCYGDTTSISINIMGGTPSNNTYTVNWSPPAATGIAVHGVGAGNYSGTIIDSMGCSATYTVGLTQPLQIAVSYTFTSGCLGSPVQFTDQSSGGPFTYVWIYGDGQPNGTIQNPQHTYAAAGSYTASLVVTNSGGCKDTLQRVVTIDPPPQAKFGGDTLTGCPQLNVLFRDSSTCTAGSIVTWSWDFGNGITSSMQYPPQIYYDNASATTPAYFPVSLTVVSTKGCSSTVTKNNYVTVWPRPDPGFYFTNDDGSGYFDVLDNNVHFHSTAVGASIYHWNLGDIFANPSSVNYTTVVNPVHKYANDEAYIYFITQEVENVHGCKDSITLPLTIKAIYTFYAPNSFSPNGDGVNEAFKATGIGIDNTTFKMWVFDRWGNMVFDSNDMEKSWDGRKNNKGDVVQEDIYVWKVNFTDVLGLKHEFHGIVSVLK